MVVNLNSMSKGGMHCWTSWFHYYCCFSTVLFVSAAILQDQAKFLFQIAFSFCTRGKNNGLLAVGHQTTSFRLGNMTDERQMVPQGGRCSDLTNDTNLYIFRFVYTCCCVCIWSCFEKFLMPAWVSKFTVLNLCEVAFWDVLKTFVSKKVPRKRSHVMLWSQHIAIQWVCLFWVMWTWNKFILECELTDQIFPQRTRSNQLVKQIHLFDPIPEFVRGYACLIFDCMVFEFTCLQPQEMHFEGTN